MTLPRNDTRIAKHILCGSTNIFEDPDAVRYYWRVYNEAKPGGIRRIKFMGMEVRKYEVEDLVKKLKKAFGKKFIKAERYEGWATSRHCAEDSFIIYIKE